MARRRSSLGVSGSREPSPSYLLQTLATSAAILSRSASLRALKGRGMATKLATTFPPALTSKVPLRGFVGFISTVAPQASLINLSSLAALLRKTPQELQRSISTTEPTAAAAFFFGSALAIFFFTAGAFAALPPFAFVVVAFLVAAIVVVVALRFSSFFFAARASRPRAREREGLRQIRTKEAAALVQGAGRRRPVGAAF